MDPFVLINPPSEFLLDDKVFPALGILTVAAELERLGVPVEMLDLAGDKNYLDTLGSWLVINHSKVLTFGVTANTPQMPYVYRILQEIRKYYPGVPVVIGGPHASFAPHHCLKLGFNFVVMDDGVDGIRQLVADPEALRYANLETRKLIKGGLIPLDEYPLPARHLIDFDSYRYTLPGTDRRATNVQGSQGCPYSCNFCLHPDTYVVTDSGVMTIAELVEQGQGMVLTSQGWKPIQAGMKRWYEGPMVWVKAQGLPPFGATPEHEVHTLGAWLPAGELVGAQRQHITVPLPPEQDVESVDLMDVLGDLRFTGYRPYSLRKGNKPSDVQALLAEGLSNNAVHKVLGVKRDTVAKIRRGECNDSTWEIGLEEKERLVRFKGGKHWLSRFLPISPDFCELVGLYLAEGHVYVYPNRPNSMSLGWTFGKTEHELIQRCIRLIQDTLGLTPGISETGTAIQVYINNSIIGQLFLRWFGRHAHGKKIPALFLGLPKGKLGRLLKGWLDGDGYLRKDKAHPYGQWRGSTVSPGLAFGMALIGRRLGHHTAVGKFYPGQSKIGGRTVNCRPRCEVSFTELHSGRNRPVHPESAEIKSATTSWYAGYVYNLEVQDFPAFTANMGEVHNCSGRELSFYRKYRTRSPEHLLQELDHLRDKYGITAFQFYDDEVNIRKDWLAQVCQALLKRGYKWRAFIKANLFDDEIAALMSKAGCVEVCTGVESGSDRILKIVQKKTTYAINLEARRVAARHGIQFKAFTMVGHASETREDIALTKQWLLEARPDSFDVTVLSPMPGSPLYDHKYPQEVRRDFEVPGLSGLELDFAQRDFAQEDSYYKTVPGEYKAWTATPSLSSADLETIRDQLDQEVREALGLPQVTRETSPYEHSMGQGG